MQDAFQQARSGRAQVVLVAGRSGVGKTTLIRRFLDQASAEDGVAVLTGRCHERELVPFKGLDGIIDALSRFLKRLPWEDARAVMPADAALIGRLFPVMERVEALTATPAAPNGTERTTPVQGAPPPTQELRRRAFDALRELVEHLARRTTLVLLLDDLQWGDSDSGELLSHLLARLSPRRSSWSAAAAPRIGSGARSSTSSRRSRPPRRGSRSPRCSCRRCPSWTRRR